MGCQLQLSEELLQLRYRHLHQFRDAPSPHFHVVGLRLEACAVAGWAGGLSAVACHHHAVLYLVLVLLHHFEEGVDAFEVGRTLPEHPSLLLGEVDVGGKDGEPRLFRSANHHLTPFAHHLASPADHGSIIDREGAVGHHQMLVNADNPSKALAGGAGSQGGVEGEHLVVGFLKGDAVGLELRAEAVEAGGAIATVEAEHAGSVALVHRCLGRVSQSADALLRGRGHHAVNHQEHHVALLVLILLDAHRLSVHLQSVESLLLVQLNLLAEGASFARHHGGEHRKSCSLLLFRHAVHDVLHRVLLHLLSAYWAEGMSHAGVEQAQVLVDFRRSAYRRAWVACSHLLLNGDSGRYALDEVTFRLAHASQELACIAAEALHVASLPLRIERIEGQR